MRMLASLGAELQMVVNHPIGAGKQTPVPVRAASSLEHRAVSPALKILLLLDSTYMQKCIHCKHSTQCTSISRAPLSRQQDLAGEATPHPFGNLSVIHPRRNLPVHGLPNPLINFFSCCPNFHKTITCQETFKTRLLFC